MFGFRHFAASATVAVALLAGGCAHERHDAIPLTAAEIGEGRGSTFYQAPADGRVYIYNASRDEMIYNGLLRRGQTIRVDADDDQVLVDNQVAVEKNLVDDHRFKIFFDRDEQAAAREAREQIVPQQTTIVAPPDARTTVTTDPNAPRTQIRVDPNAPRTTIETEPAAAPRTTVTTESDAKTTVTTPDAKVTTDPESGRTTVQPR